MLSICTHAHSQSLSPLIDGRVNNIPLQINKALLQLIDAKKVIPLLFKPETKKNGNNLC